jgi:hypothetical protein
VAQLAIEQLLRDANYERLVALQTECDPGGLFG